MKPRRTDAQSDATTVYQQATLYVAQRAFDKAEALYELRICKLETLLSPQHRAGAFDASEPLHARALRISEIAFGTDYGPEAIALLLGLGTVHRERGDYDTATLLCERALHGFEGALGPDHPDLAASLSILAMLHQLQGAYDKAEPLAERLLAIQERVFGADHEEVADALHITAALHHARGAYAKAEPLYERALRLQEQRHGPEHPELVAPLNGLAALYKDTGADGKAKPLYERALRIQEKLHEGESSEVVAPFDGRDAFDDDTGADGDAEDFYERVIRVARKASDSRLPTLLSNLGALYEREGRYDQAAPLLERAVRLSEQLYGTEHPELAETLHNLARLHDERGAHAEAERLLQRAIRVFESTAGSEHPKLVVMLGNLAASYQSRGAHAEAIPIYERALRISANRGGEEHPYLAWLLGNLAMLYWTIGDVANALDHYTRAMSIRERHLSRTLATLPETRQRFLLVAHRAEVERVVAFHAHFAPRSAAALQLALTATLQNKGRVLSESVRAQDALRRNLSPGLLAELDALQARRTELANRRRAPADLQHAEPVEAIEQDIERREHELGRKSAAFRREIEPVSIEAIQAAIPDRAALIEFVRHRRFDPNDRWSSSDEPQYVAYILQREGSPRWVPLGEAEPIEASVTAARSALTQWRSDSRDALRALDRLVFAPIRGLLGDTVHFLLSPDAALHLVPFAALVDEHGRYLVERLLITYLSSGRDLVRSDGTDAPRSRPLIVAAPDYQGRAVPLPGTQAEAAVLQTYFADVDLHVGPHATKDKLTAARGPMFVHVASHGFFCASTGHAVAAALRAARSWRDERDVVAAWSALPAADERVDIEDALDDAGLVLAGADTAAATLTAREIASIDLRGTKLVVLSACDTGVGQVAHSEGVYGLRRALAVAGAETQVVSLWKVDDRGTSALMEHYYRGLCRGSGRSEALRQAQLALLGDGEHGHPFYWAAFVPVGNEDPLPVELSSAARAKLARISRQPPRASSDAGAQATSQAMPDRLVGPAAAPVPDVVEPEPDSELHELRALMAVRDLIAADDPGAVHLLGDHFDYLGMRLAAVGERDAALTAGSEAVALYRDLVSRDPDGFRHELARSLGNLAIHLGALAQHERALAVTRESVGLCRDLASRRPERFEPHLARSLHGLGAMLSELGQREAAIGPMQEAVAVYRRLASRDPETFQGPLAGNLNNLGNTLGKLGDLERGLALLREAVDIYHALTARRPDAFAADLAGTLSNFRRCCGRPGGTDLRSRPCARRSISTGRSLRAIRTSSPPWRATSTTWPSDGARWASILALSPRRASRSTRIVSSRHASRIGFSPTSRDCSMSSPTGGARRASRSRRSMQRARRSSCIACWPRAIPRRSIRTSPAA